MGKKDPIEKALQRMEQALRAEPKKYKPPPGPYTPSVPSIAIGQHAKTTGQNAIAIGSTAQATLSGSWCPSGPPSATNTAGLAWTAIQRDDDDDPPGLSVSF